MVFKLMHAIVVFLLTFGGLSGYAMAMPDDDDDNDDDAIEVLKNPLDEPLTINCSGMIGDEACGARLKAHIRNLYRGWTSDDELFLRCPQCYQKANVKAPLPKALTKCLRSKLIAFPDPDVKVENAAELPLPITKRKVEVTCECGTKFRFRLRKAMLQTKSDGTKGNHDRTVVPCPVCESDVVVDKIIAPSDLSAYKSQIFWEGTQQ